MTSSYIFIGLLVSTIVTYGLRLVPYALFRKHDVLPQRLDYIAQLLPKAIMTTLVIYCVKDVNFTSGSFGIPELISIACVIGLHVWKKNILISIFVPTVLYMILVQMVFV